MFKFKNAFYYLILSLFLLTISVLFYNYVLKPKAFLNESITNNNPLQNTTEFLSSQYISPISIEFLRKQSFPGSELKIEKTLSDGTNYHRYIASYMSEGNKIYGLLTIPFTTDEGEKFPAIVFNHGYIPPMQYKTEEKYVPYVDYLAKNKFIVFKIDLRGHGNSEGNPSGSYFSNAYTFDVLNAVNSLKGHLNVDSDNIGLWGHSMSGNLVLRSALVSDSIKAGVIWAGAVYSYEDFAKYRISDSSFRGTPTPTTIYDKSREASKEVSDLRSNPESVDFSTPFWQSISLTQNLKYLNTPLQFHHSEDDDVVNVGYTKDIEIVLDEQGKENEVYYYKGGGHNINSPYFEEAMQRTVEFFNKHLR